MIIWVQLWFPLMAIINLFATMAIERDLNALTGIDEMSAESVSGTLHLIQVASTHIGTAGMLAAAVPALAYTLISMSPMAFTHLMGRMQGHDTINEKIVAPDVMTPSTGVRVDPVKQSSEFGGTMHAGAQAEGGTYSFGYSASERLSDARSAAYRATEGYTQTAASIALRNASFGERWDTSMQQAFNSNSLVSESGSVSKDEADSFRSGASTLLAERFGIEVSERSSKSTTVKPVNMALAATRLRMASELLDKACQRRLNSDPLWPVIAD